MARNSAESKIPIFYSNPLKNRITKPLSTLSNRVRAHLDGARGSSPGVLFGLLKTASTPQSQPQSLPVEAAVSVGDRVRLANGRTGILRFRGRVHFAEGVWCGIEVDGGGDGNADGVRYFECSDGAVWATEADVRSDDDWRVEYPEVDSGPHSLLDVTCDMDQQEKECGDAENIFKTDSRMKYSCTHLQQSSQVSTPTSNSSSSFIPPWEWKSSSQRSSSVGSLGLSQRAATCSNLDILSTSLQMSKHSSIECDESLGILTPDQMVEFTVGSGDGSLLTEDPCNEFVEEESKEQVDASENGLMQCSTMHGDRVFERLFSESDTCMMTVSSLSEHKERRSPSLEELPIDDASTDATTATTQSSASCFVTSVTSVGSWDNGYQGDGEFSRPTSRGADASPSMQFPVDKKSFEPLTTDSDFFTESEPDAYDDLSAAKGDRRACIIDGKLYAAPAVNTTVSSCQQVVSTTEVRESHEPHEMDSSGVYSDLERRSESVERPTALNLTIVTPKVESQSDTSGNSTTKSISSQKLLSDELKPKEPEVKKEVIVSKTSSGVRKVDNCLKRRNENIPSPARCKVASKDTVQNPKMPRRNVSSKVKSGMTVGAKRDENEENRQPVTRKPAPRRDVVCKAEKIRAPPLQNGPRVPTAPRVTKPFLPIGNAANSALGGSTRSLKDVTGRVKNRKTRLCAALISPVQSSAAAASVSLSLGSSRQSSITDISDSHADASQHSLPAVVTSRTFSKGRKASSPIRSPLSESAVPIKSSLGYVRGRTSTLPGAKAVPKSTAGNTLTGATMKTPRKINCRRNLPKVVPLKDQNRISNGSCETYARGPPFKLLQLENGTANHRIPNGETANHHPKAKHKAPKPDSNLANVKHVTTGMEALALLFQHITADVDVFVLPRIKRELARIKSELLDTKLKLEEESSKCKKLHEEVDLQNVLHEQKLDEIRSIHSEQLNVLSQSHKQDLEECILKYEKKLTECEEKFKTEEQMLHTKFNEEVSSIERQANEKVEFVVEQTTKQLEILKTESLEWRRTLSASSTDQLKSVERQYVEKEKALVARIDQLEAEHACRLEAMENEFRQKEEELLIKLSRQELEYNRYKAEQKRLEQEDSIFIEDDAKYEIRPVFQNLEDEVCSLRVVLDIKHAEIQQLRKTNEILRREVQDLPHITQKLDSAQARVEDLNAQLESKSENEKRLSKENQKLSEILQYEVEKKNRLSFQNEELLWKLKKSTQVAKALAVFQSKRKHFDTEMIQHHSTPFKTEDRGLHLDLRTGHSKCLRRSKTDDEIHARGTVTAESQPKVLGVVEKNDSVSWVLEMDESPTAVASRMLRRANSLRGEPTRRPHAARHSLTLPARKKRPRAVSHPTQTVAQIVDSPTKANDDIESDISSFFDFLHDADLEEGDFYKTALDSTVFQSPYCSSSSSESSLDFVGSEEYRVLSTSNKLQDKLSLSSSPNDILTDSDSSDVSSRDKYKI